MSETARGTLWDAADLRARAEAWLRATGDSFGAFDAACAFVDVELWRIMLDTDVSRDEAVTFCKFQGDLLPQLVLPDFTKALPADPLGFGAFKRVQLAYVDRMKASAPIQQHTKVATGGKIVFMRPCVFHA